MVAVGFQVENLWEFKVLVDFVISKRIEVEYNPLQVNNQHVWGLCNQGSFADVNCLLASITFVVVDHLTLNHFLKTVLDWIDVFNC